MQLHHRPPVDREECLERSQPGCLPYLKLGTCTWGFIWPLK